MRDRDWWGATVWILAAVMLAALVAPLSVSATEKDLLDVLLENGTITRSQYDQLLHRNEEEQPLAAVEAASDDGVEVGLGKSGLTVESNDGDFAVTVGGRVQALVAGHVGDLPEGADATDGTELRRARIALKGKVFGDWLWVSEVDFADNETAIKDFWLGYAGLPGNTRVYAGHQKQPFSLSVEMSTNDIPFIERSIDNELIIPFIDRAIGVRADTWGEHWFLATGFYGESIDPNRDDDEGWGTTGRFVVSPLISDEHVLHLGARAAYRRTSPASDALRVRDETTHFSNLRIVNTGDITGVDGVTLVGGEAALALGPFSVFGEYNEVFFDREVGADLDFDSWHVAGTWTITGESRAKAYKMKSGEFKRLRPARDFTLDGGGWGAWELAARLASLDANDNAIRGGEEMVLTTALNWYINPVVRFMVEWSRVLDTDDGSELRNDAEDLNILQLRADLAF